MTPRLRTLRSFGAVHETVSAAVIMLAAITVALAVGGRAIPGVMDGRAVLISVGCALICGIGGARLIVCRAKVLAPQSRHRSIGDLLWAISSLIGSVAGAVLCSVGTDAVTTGATVRNALIGWSLAVLAIALGGADVSWIAPLLCLGATTLFSTADPNGQSNEWWGALLNPRSSTAELTISPAAALVAFLLWNLAQKPRIRRLASVARRRNDCW